jgi:hypothetical protein
MKRIMTFAFALMVASIAFGQKKTAGNPLVSEQNYKHPFAAATAKENNVGATEKFTAEEVSVAADYKHPNRKQTVKRTRIRQGDGVSPAASQKHPFGS